VDAANFRISVSLFPGTELDVTNFVIQSLALTHIVINVPENYELPLYQYVADYDRLVVMKLIAEIH
jgi:hypothetical protein